jgi:hypothetical protein
VVPEKRWQRFWLDLLLLATCGLLMGELGPYPTADAPDALRRAYWLVAVLGAGLSGILADKALGPRIREFWPRIALVSLAITPPVTLFIYALNAIMLDLPRRPWLLPQLAWQVLVVTLLIMTLRALLWRRVVQTRTVVMAPLPDTERSFRLRLSAKRRAARLIALEAEDHYVRVHTDSGSELVPMRFSEAIEELAKAWLSTPPVLMGRRRRDRRYEAAPDDVHNGWEADASSEETRLVHAGCSCYVPSVDMLSLGQEYPPASRRPKDVGGLTGDVSRIWEAFETSEPVCAGDPPTIHVTLVPVAPVAHAGAKSRTRSGLARGATEEACGPRRDAHTFFGCPARRGNCVKP